MRRLLQEVAGLFHEGEGSGVGHAAQPADGVVHAAAVGQQTRGVELPAKVAAGGCAQVVVQRGVQGDVDFPAVFIKTADDVDRFGVAQGGGFAEPGKGFLAVGVHTRA